MIAAAYCCARYERVARRVIRATPFTCPPWNQDRLPALEGHRFLYIDLYGAEGQPWWAGDDGVIAITAWQLESLDLRGTVVFSLACWLPESPMLAALQKTGAVVIGGSGLNWAGVRQLSGGALLARWVWELLRTGVEPEWALTQAQRRLSRPWYRGKAVADARGFQIWRDGHAT